MTENYLADVQITPRAGILDPVGETIASALGNLGYEDVRSVRAGRLIRLEVEAETAQAAQTAVESMCEELIANPIIEDYLVTVRDVEK
jgi:phosphoribosylformylglycinamidine synthase